MTIHLLTMGPIRAEIQPFLLCIFSTVHNIWYVFRIKRGVKNFIRSLWNDLLDNFSSDTLRSPINPKKPAQTTQGVLTFHVHVYGHTHMHTQQWNNAEPQNTSSTSGTYPLNPSPNTVPLSLSLTLPSQDTSWIGQLIIIYFLFLILAPWRFKVMVCFEVYLLILMDSLHY